MADCVIKIIQGPESGQEFRCSATETVLGRSPRSHVRLGSPSISFEHAVVLRNGNEFFLENLSASGTFVNDEKISGRVKLRARDLVRLGQETVVRVETLPSVGVELGRRRILVIAVLAMLVLLVVLLVANPLDQRPANIDWQHVYTRLDNWVHAQANAGRIPQEAAFHLEQAWRLREAGDSAGANKEWIRLRVLLAGIEDKTALQAESDSDRTALARLLNPPKEDAGRTPTDDQMGAALVQFVSRMARNR
ncbi:MAG TPA: FHA domain-containing protein [Phycisphaerae bacterium]|nr:FHA domain-containing protein [Phycisphaerae bacterium]